MLRYLLRTVETRRTIPTRLATSRPAVASPMWHSLLCHTTTPLYFLSLVSKIQQKRIVRLQPLYLSLPFPPLLPPFLPPSLPLSFFLSLSLSLSSSLPLSLLPSLSPSSLSLSLFLPSSSSLSLSLPPSLSPSLPPLLSLSLSPSLRLSLSPSLPSSFSLSLPPTPDSLSEELQRHHLRPPLRWRAAFNEYIASIPSYYAQVGTCTSIHCDLLWYTVVYCGIL